jgi:formamidopyrimidine-DNA glycosylase
MPELPEVETIRRGLEGFVLGRRLARVVVFEGKSFLGRAGDVEGRRVTGLKRRGKALILGLEGGVNLLVHLRMTGQLVFRGGEERFAGGHPTEDFLNDLPSRHTRVSLEFEGGARLFFNDQRKFGFMKVLTDAEVEEDSFVRRLGKDALGEDFGWRDLKEGLARHGRSGVKVVLLDQSVVAGVGNIYADESLFFAGVHPARLAGSLSDAEARRIWEGIRESMGKSIAAGGSSLRNYVKADGERGNYLDLFAQVFGKEGSKCPRCGVEIVKIRAAGRGTHICPNCQRLEGK